MTAKKIQSRPSRRRAAKKPAAKPLVSKKAQAPIVDVPTTNESSIKVEEFIKTYKPEVKKYCKKNFGSEDKTTIDAVIRECAECVVNNRTPKKDKLWNDDPTIIEEIISKACKPVEEAVKTKPEDTVSKSQEKRVAVQKKAAKKVTKKAAKKVEKKVAKKVTKKAAPKKVAKKKAAKKVVAKKKTTKKVVAKKPAVKKTAVAKKKPVQVKGIKVDVERVKTTKGTEQFEAALLLLKRQRKAWIQAQDIPTVAAHLFAVANKKAEMAEKIDGQGEKDYGKRRLVTMLEGVQKLIATNK